MNIALGRTKSDAELCVISGASVPKNTMLWHLNRAGGL
jgi:hypothetical protein